MINKTALILELTGEEGKRRFVYDDATGAPLSPGVLCKGHPTVGIGRALDVHGISVVEGQLLRANDIQAGRSIPTAFNHVCYDDHDGRPVVPGHSLIGHPCIGYGRLLDSVGLLDTEITAFLANDIDDCERMVLKVLPWYAQQSAGRQQALLDLTFNMGLSHLLGFHNTLAAFQSGNYGAAVEGLRNSLWAKQVQPARLQNIVNLIERG